MSDVIAPTKTVTFTVNRVPHRHAEVQTIMRLMRMEPGIQNGLKKLARRRRQTGNESRQRAGRQWIVRPRATKIVSVEKGRSFTIRITPGLMNDIASVQKFLDAKSAK